MAGAAIHNCANKPPAVFSGQPLDLALFQTYDGLPNDWHLRLTQTGRRTLRGEIEATEEIPIRP